MRHEPLITPGYSSEHPASRRRWRYGVIAAAAAAGLVAAAGPALANTASTSAAPASLARTGTARTGTARTGTAAANSFTRTNLIASNSSFGAKLVDKNLTNAWGLAAGPNEPLWVSDNNSGMATVYSGGVKGSAVSLELTVPVPGGNPTGQVFNGDSSAFHVGGASGGAADFIVDSDSIGTKQSPGEIAAWNGGAKFVVEDSPTGGPGGKTPAKAVFKGLAEATTPTAGPELFATDVANASVDIFNSKFAPVSAPTEFKDPKIPSDYTPFNVQLLGGDLYVSYGKQNASKTDVVRGAGLGYVDVYSVDGKLLHHLVSAGTTSPLNAPWGLAIAPKGFGPFAGDLLVGNLGNGWINAFNPTTGAFAGTLDGSNGYPITISGLWGLQVGNSAFGGASSLVFSAGPGGYSDGLVGELNPAG
jgi:uncharacterized protein (TIGR03118 family)